MLRPRSFLGLLATTALALLPYFLVAAKGPSEEELKEFFETNHANLTQLTPWNFEEKVGKDQHVLVMFAAPWCSACKRYYPKFVETAMMLKGIPGLTIARADVTEFEYEELQKRLEVAKVPTIKIFKKGSTKPLPIIPQEAWEMHFAIKEKIGLPVPNKCLFGESDAEDVTSANWDKVVLDPKVTTLVEFYAPWCQHCKAFTTTYNNIARKALKLPDVRVVRVNVDKHKALGQRYGVKILPDMRIFSKKNKAGIKYDTPAASEHLEMIDKILEKLKSPDATDAQEAEATDLVTRVRASQAAGDTAGAVQMLREAASIGLNTTVVWHEQVRALQGEIHEAHATQIKDKAVGLAGEGQCAEALPLLEGILQEYATTKVAASEAVENVVHNCRATLKAK